MAEPSIYYNDQNYTNKEQNSTSENQNNASSDDNSTMLADDSMVTTETTALDEPKSEVSKDLTSSNEEQHVESPTTGESIYSFKCVFCEQALTASDEPKLLECLHNACASCLGNKIYEHQDQGLDKTLFECPLCVLPIDPNKVIENQFLLELSNNDDSNNIHKTADIKCSSCNDDANASSWCVDCSEFICDNCVQAHQRLKITKDHTIKPKEDGLNDNHLSSNTNQNTLFCLIHPHERLSLFCETCDRLTCRDCQLIEHREHKYKFTNEMAIETRKFIADMLKDVGYKRVLLNSAMKVIDDRETLITDKKQALVKEITQLVVKLTNTINVRGKQLVAKLTEVCDSKQKTLQEKKEALQQLSQMTDHCIEFTQHALDNGSDMALLFCRKHMTDHLRRIKCKRADIPNPEIPVRIHLALDKVPDLIKVMSTIGQIVVDGRVYPSQTQSPLPPPNSPSPNRPPQQQSPISPMMQAKSPNFPQTLSYQSTNRLPPPYNPPYPPNNQQFQQNMMGMQPNLGQKLMRPPAMTPLNPSPPISLTQQLNMPSIIRMQQRPPMQQRPLLPRLPPNLMGVNQHQQQVSSSTHPHQAMMQDRNNLRGLLQTSNNSSNSNNGGQNNNAVYVQTGPAQYQAVQPNFAQQFQQNRFPSNNQMQQQQQQQQSILHQLHQQNSLRALMPNQQQQQQPNRMGLQMQRSHNNSNQFQPQQNSLSAKWHIPQQQLQLQQQQQLHQLNRNNHNINNNNMILPALNDNFKITLKQQQQNLPSTVTSTIPKTPSPNNNTNNNNNNNNSSSNNNNSKTDTERNIDKFCQDSVNDLIATIAKLDSNGVQVLAEGSRQKNNNNNNNNNINSSSPLVDSSTGDTTIPTTIKIKSDPLDNGKDDPNEDWCAVCMDGGELVCCDKCPKVFHQYCHIPNLAVEENDTWQCLLCMNFADIPHNIMNDEKNGELTFKEKKIIERIVLEMYCQYDPSLPFREIIGPEIVEYHTIIKNPIALDTIRQKLNWENEGHYTDVEQLIRDVRLMFKNAYTYNSVDTQVYTDAKTLERFFDQQLEKFLPEYAYENFDDDELHPPNKKYRRIITD